MDSLQWETINQNEFSIFMRDLTMTSNTNLKHMIEDMDNANQKVKEEKQNHKKKKKVVVKKKDLIIAEQNKKRYLKNIENDTKTIDFLFRNLDNKNPYLNFDTLKTEEGADIDGYIKRINGGKANLEEDIAIEEIVERTEPKKPEIVPVAQSKKAG